MDLKCPECGHIILSSKQLKDLRKNPGSGMSSSKMFHLIRLLNRKKYLTKELKKNDEKLRSMMEEAKEIMECGVEND